MSINMRQWLAQKARSTRILRSFVRQEDGSAAVEFGIVLMPFLALMFAIIETALVFFAGQTLETAGADAARLIMTGQAQTKPLDQNAFKQEVCKRLVAMFDCNTGVHVDVRTYKSFGTANLEKPIDNQGKLVKDFTYEPGGPGDIVIVRLMYEWPVWVSLMGLNLADMAGGKRLLLATAAFRNEPYK